MRALRTCLSSSYAPSARAALKQLMKPRLRKYNPEQPVALRQPQLRMESLWYSIFSKKRERKDWRMDSHLSRAHVLVYITYAYGELEAL